MKIPKKSGFIKPKTATAKEWMEWHILAKKEYPVKYWFTEKLIPMIQEYMYHNYIHSLRNYLINRHNNTHVLSSKQFKQGVWIDLCDRMLPCLFDELADFVEIELASIHTDYKYNFFSVRSARSKELGLAFLEEYISDDRNKKIKMLYLWWTETVPNRKDIWSCEHSIDQTTLEKQYDDEDTKMLIELIKIRGYLWT